MSRFPVITTTADGATVVALSGDVDLLAAPYITKCMDAVTRGRRPRVVVDLRSVAFIDCRGLSILTRARHRIVERAGKLCLVVRDEQVLDVLRKTELADTFHIRAELPLALDLVALALPESAVRF